MVEVKLLRPLDGREIGDTAEYPDADAKRLQARGAVKIVGTKSAAPAENKMERAPDNKDVKRPAKKGD